MDLIKNLPSKLAFIIFAAASCTLALLWLCIPQYSIKFFSTIWVNGWQLTSLLIDLNRGFLAFLLLGNVILPGVALLLSFMKRNLNWLWASISLAWYFTTGFIILCTDGLTLNPLWIIILSLYAAIAAFAWLRRGCPTSLS